MPLSPSPVDGGGYILLRGRAYEPHELRTLGEPWAGFADAPAHLNHIPYCPSWPRAEPNRGISRGFLPHRACMRCGTIDDSVRLVGGEDVCRDCRTSRPQTVDTPQPTLYS
jgi:hypothetical protein